MPSLAKYRQMRDFDKTPEPAGGRARELGKKTKPKRKPETLSFVIQKHDARNLHYDFRLELDGVLLSWAVPKGPSVDPSVKRLAMETEPHPLEYASFEGTIPKGEYGGGTVMVWDRGTWKPKSDPRKGYENGRLDFELEGEKLHGGWHLVRTRSGDKGKSWLLFKSRDDFAQGDADAIVRGAPDSALTGRNLDEIASGAEGADEPPESSEGRDNLPDAVEPELATLVEAAPEGDQWLHELKFDGYRLLARMEGGKVTLLTRHGHDWTERMPELAKRLSQLGVESALLDGELVALNQHGVSDFQRLQNALGAGRTEELVYFAFDVLHLNGRDLRALPLLERKERLRQLISARAGKLAEQVRFSAHVNGRGATFFENACRLGLEGIICKRASSTYRSGRGRDWLKVKCQARQEFVIVGFTEPAGSRQHLGALALGVMRDGELTYAGRVGTGFNAASLRELEQKLTPLRIAKPAVLRAPRGAEGRDVRWVEPVLLAEVAFTGFTSEGLLRHPTFKGLREDKQPEEVTLEEPKVRSSRKAGVTNYSITNPDKVLYPEQGITKRELLDYYALVADRMLPHVANRPLTLVRCPNGHTKPCFFQKHPGEGTPEGLRAITIREKEGKAPYSVIDDERGLFGLVQLGALEIHTWGSHADDFEHADILVFDLDPDPELDFAHVIAGARRVREIFAGAGLESFVKTTGGKGLHVCIPIEPAYDWDVIKSFCQRVADSMAAEAPDLYLATVSKARRKRKIFVDYLRNARGATFIAPYSTRARQGAPVAVPLEWDELDPKLKPDHFTLRNIAARLKSLRRDPFERLAKLEQRLVPAESDETAPLSAAAGRLAKAERARGRAALAGQHR
jgi:bifunctional non-homologous end joining protein LigD